MVKRADQGGGREAAIHSGLDSALGSHPCVAVICTRVRELQEPISAVTIALEISSRNSRVAALQKRWDRLRARLDLILDQRGADMADLPGGATGLLCRDYKGKEADRKVHRIDPGVVSLVADLRGADPGATWIAGT
jgi:hypothetical protein